MAQIPTFLLVHDKQSYILDSDTCIVGRGFDCDIPLDDEEVSRKHAMLVFSGNTFVAQDLDSRNGTYINGRRLSGSQGLQPGDTIKLGSQTILKFVVETEAASRHPKPISISKSHARRKGLSKWAANRSRLSLRQRDTEIWITGAITIIFAVVGIILVLLFFST